MSLLKVGASVVGMVLLFVGVIVLLTDIDPLVICFKQCGSERALAFLLGPRLFRLLVGSFYIVLSLSVLTSLFIERGMRCIKIFVGVSLIFIGIFFWLENGRSFEGFVFSKNTFGKNPLHLSILGVALIAYILLNDWLQSEKSENQRKPSNKNNSSTRGDDCQR